MKTIKTILLTSAICFVLTHAASGQTPSPTPVFKPKPTPEFKVSVIEEVILVPVPTSTPRPQLTNNTKIESSPLDDETPKTFTPQKYETMPGKPELKQRPSWTHLTDGVEGETKDVSVYYRNAERKYGGDVEVWLQFLYAKPKLVMKKRAAYHIGFATLHCDDKRISIESGVWYDTGGKTIPTPFASLNNEYRKPIVPDSVGETVWEHFCRR